MEWKSMETAPRDGTEFLCRWQPIFGAEQTVIARWIDERPWVGFHGLNVRDLGGRGSISALSGGFPEARLLATHWMPLPAPPAA